MVEAPGWCEFLLNQSIESFRYQITKSPTDDRRGDIKGKTGKRTAWGEYLSNFETVEVQAIHLENTILVGGWATYPSEKW